MPAPPTTRASRSRYSSPAVGGAASSAGARTEGSSRRRGADKDKDRDSHAATSSAARASSTERSRRFMENWIEPERVRMPSFQEHGLVRQGVLETMEPLGTTPKPAMIKKLTGIGREGSPTTSSARGGKKKIILKRKNGATTARSSAAGGATGPASSALGVPELLSGTQSPTPSTVATPQPATSPTPAPVPEHSSVSTVIQNSPPTPTAKVEHLETPALIPLSDAISEMTPEPQLDSVSRPTPSSPPPNVWDNIHRDQLRPPSSTADPFLTDPIKESIEETALRDLPGTPQSAHSSALTYDSVTDEYYKRGTSIPGRSLFSIPARHAAGSEIATSLSVLNADEDAATSSTRTQQHIAQSLLGPWYTEAELNRIIQQKDLVKMAIDYGVAEAIKYRCYVDAYALRLAYDENQENARFLLQTEAVYRQVATREAAGEWARTLQPYKIQGQENQKALKYFVPEAESDKDFDFETHKPLQAPFLHLISIDMKEVRNPRPRRATPPASSAGEAQNHDHDESMVPLQVGETHSHKAHAQPEEPEQPERVATPPRKRQKTQTQTGHSSHARKASKPSAAAARAMDTAIRGKVAAPPEPRSVRAGSSNSDVSSLSSARSITPVEETGEDAGQAAQPSRDGSQAAMQEGEEGQSHLQGQLSGNIGLGVQLLQVPGANTAHTAQAAAPVQPITEPLIRRLPARKARNNLAPGAYMVLPPDSDAVSNNNPNLNFRSHPQSSSNTNLADTHHNPDTMSLGKSRHNSDEGSAPKTQQPSKRSQRGLPDYAPANKLDPADDKMLKRAAARKRTQELTEEVRSTKPSFVRGEPARASLEPERPGSSSSELSSVPEVEELDLELEPVTQQKGRATGTRATRANKRGHDEMDEYNTPFSEDFGVDAGTSTGGPSRAVTPRPQKKQKKEVRRFKQSPTKNKAGSSAAAGVVPTRAANRSSPGLNGAPSNQEDNDDFCSFCGGTGNLVCCDGCNKAFHYMDHEPVVDPDDDTAWFCWDCMVKRDPSLVGQHKGPFGALLTNLDKRHAKAFMLPRKVRDYFEGVRTGADGEYEEFIPPTKGKKKKETEEEKKGVFDSYQIVDKDNQPILCHACSQSAGFGTSKRDIIPCSLCGLWWHADCLDPPKPTPPNPKTFVCPCHAIDLLHKIPAQLGPAHKFRKIKGAPDINYAFRRGNVNNGWIDVEEDDSDDDVMSVRMGLRDPDSWGKKYTLKASGIRDDFITKIGRPQRPLSRIELPAVDYEEGAEERYEAALNILAFSRKVRAESRHPVESGPVALAGVSNDMSMKIYKQQIETAGNTELEAMQQQLMEMQESISAQLRKRNGQDEPRQGPSKTRKMTRGKLVSASKTAEQTTEASKSSEMEAGSITVEDNNSRLESSARDLGFEKVEARRVATPAVEGPSAPILETKEASGDERKNSAKHPLAKRRVAPDGVPAVPTDTHTTNVDEPVATANNDKTVTEVEPGHDTIVKAMVEKHVDQIVDAALTPPSDMPKDGDELTTNLTVMKPASNGVETPETTVADQTFDSC